MLTTFSAALGEPGTIAWSGLDAGLAIPRSGRGRIHHSPRAWKKDPGEFYQLCFEIVGWVLEPASGLLRRQAGRNTRHTGSGHELFQKFSE